jgi:ABC-type multidrug transport system ATPase subunit
MKISLTNAGKRFNREWIFRNLSCEFNSGNAYAITGPNGSGKSTLLQVIGGSMVVSEGQVNYEMPEEQVYRHISITAPYLEVIEEMTAKEFLHFHAQFKPFLPALSVNTILEKVGLLNAANKQIRYYSSGMKQRVKLAQSIFSDVSCVLLDEPCTNLDAEGIALYQALIKDYGAGRLVIVSSNDEQEYSFCNERLNILDFK